MKCNLVLTVMYSDAALRMNHVDLFLFKSAWRKGRVSHQVWLLGSHVSLPTLSMQNFCGPLLPEGKADRMLFITSCSDHVTVMRLMRWKETNPSECFCVDETWWDCAHCLLLLWWWWLLDNNWRTPHLSARRILLQEVGRFLWQTAAGESFSRCPSLSPPTATQRKDYCN